MNDKKKELRMKMKLMWGALMAIAFASCTQEDVLNNGVGQNTLRASMEETGAKSRVGFTDQTAGFFWTKGDQIGVTTASSQTFQGMTLVGNGGEATGTFSGTMSAAASGYAVYPYGAFERHSVTENTLTYKLPAEYTYTALDTEYAKSDGNSHNAPMWGSISNGSVSFKHLGGVIAFSVSELPESTDNLEFVLTATNQISGSFSATLTENEPKIEAATTNVADADKKVTITFSTAAGQTSGYFYVPVPTGTLGNLSLVILNGENEVATGAWDNITIARKDIKRATIGDQSIIGGNGEIKQVASVSDVKNALDTNEDNLTVQVSDEVAGTGNTIEIPKTLETATTTFSFASVANGAKITIEDEDGGSYDGKIIIEIPEDETLPEVVANIPYGEVYIKQGTVTTLVTSAADNTTIIGANAKIGTLTVVKGNVRIEDGGQVTKIERASENTPTVYVVYESETAPTIETIGEGVVLMSAAEWELKKAIEDENTSSYQLQNDIVLVESLTIPTDKTFTLDLNGKTISQEKECAQSYEMIANNGTLVITGNGKISFKDTSAGDPTFGWGSYTIRNSGSLTVENGTIEHLGEQDFATHMICAIFQYSGSTTIKDGTISTPSYRSARLWHGEMKIEGGIFDGQLWVQTQKGNPATLTIEGGTFRPNGNDGSSVFVGNDNNTVNLSITGGTFNTKIGCSDATKEGVKGSVKGGIFTEIAKANTNNDLIAAGYDFEAKEDGTYTLVYDASKAVVATLDELQAALENNEITTIKLGADLTISSKLSITRHITLDGNGKTLTYTGQERAIDVTKETNGANLTLKNLTIDCTASYCQRGVNYNTNGKLVLDNVTVEGTNVTYALNLPGSSSNAQVTINESSLTGCIALNVWGANSTINVTNSHLTSVDKADHENYPAVSLNNDGTTIANGTVVTITGGSITAKDENGNASSAVRNSSDTGKVNVSNTTTVTGNIVEPVAVVLYEGYNEFYSCMTLNDAIEEALKDGTGKASVKVIKDIELDADNTITIPNGKTLVIDLNGKTVSQTSTTPVSMITNNGNLTIKDSSNGSGKIAFTFNGTVNNGVAANAISNRGTLVVEGGEISNTGTGTQIGYAIDNYNGSTLTVEGGKITASGSSYYDGIRLFCGSNETTVTVNNGEISSIWAQNPSTNKATEVNGTVIFNGGTVNTIYYENYTTVKVKTGVTAAVIPNGEGKENITTTTEGEYTVYSFVHNEE